jgi:hypothetical protein
LVNRIGFQMKIEQQSSKLQKVLYTFSDVEIKKALIDLIRGNPYMGKWNMEWNNEAEGDGSRTITLLHTIDTDEGEPKEWIEMSEEERKIAAGWTDEI